MKNELTINKAVELKEKAESDIKNILRKLQCETGLKVKDVEFIFINSNSYNYEAILSPRIILKL